MAKRVELSTIRQKMLELSQQIKSKKELLQKLKSERDVIQKELEDLNTKIQDLNKRIDELTAKVNEKGNEIGRIKEELKKRREEVRNMNVTDLYEQQLRSTINSEALENKRKQVEEKLKNNKRLSFDELLILYYNKDNSDGQTNSDIR